MTSASFMTCEGLQTRINEILGSRERETSYIIRNIYGHDNQNPTDEQRYTHFVTDEINKDCQNNFNVTANDSFRKKIALSVYAPIKMNNREIPRNVDMISSFSSNSMQSGDQIINKLQTFGRFDHDEDNAQQLMDVSSNETLFKALQYASLLLKELTRNDNDEQFSDEKDPSVKVVVRLCSLAKDLKFASIASAEEIKSLKTEIENQKRLSNEETSRMIMELGEQFQKERRHLHKELTEVIRRAEEATSEARFITTRAHIAQDELRSEVAVKQDHIKKLEYTITSINKAHKFEKGRLTDKVIALEAALNVSDRNFSKFKSSFKSNQEDNVSLTGRLEEAEGNVRCLQNMLVQQATQDMDLPEQDNSICPSKLKCDAFSIDICLKSMNGNRATKADCGRDINDDWAVECSKKALYESVLEAVNLSKKIFTEMDPKIYEKLFVKKKFGPETLPSIIYCLYALACTLKSDAARVTSNLNSLTSEVQQKELDLVKDKEELKRATDEIINRERENMKSEIAQITNIADAAATDARRALNEACKAKEQLADKLTHKLDELHDLESKFVKVSVDSQMSISDLKHSIKMIETTVQAKEVNIKQLVRHRDELEKSNASLTFKLQVTEDQLRELEHRLTKKTFKMETQEEKLRTTLESLNRIQEMTSIAGQTSNRIQTVLCKMGDVATLTPHVENDKRDYCVITIKRLSEDASRLLAEFNKMTDEKIKLMQALKTQGGGDQELQSKMSKLKHRLTRFEEERTSMTQILDAKSNELNTINDERNHLEKVLKERTAELACLRTKTSYLTQKANQPKPTKSPRTNCGQCRKAFLKPHEKVSKAEGETKTRRNPKIVINRPDDYSIGDMVTSSISKNKYVNQRAPRSSLSAPEATLLSDLNERVCSIGRSRKHLEDATQCINAAEIELVQGDESEVLNPPFDEAADLKKRLENIKLRTAEIEVQDENLNQQGADLDSIVQRLHNENKKLKEMNNLTTNGNSKPLIQEHKSRLNSSVNCSAGADDGVKTMSDGHSLNHRYHYHHNHQHQHHSARNQSVSSSKQVQKAKSAHMHQSARPVIRGVGYKKMDDFKPPRTDETAEELTSRLHNSMKQLKVSAEQLMQRARSSSREIVRAIPAGGESTEGKKRHSLGDVELLQPRSTLDGDEALGKRMANVKENTKRSQSFSIPSLRGNELNAFLIDDTRTPIIDGAPSIIPK